MKLQGKIFGVDVDNTLTGLPPFDVDNMDLEETRKIIRKAPVKKGIEILSIMCIKPVIITGRGDYFRADTVYWLEENNIDYTKLITIDRDKYPGRKFNFKEYLDYKVNAYLDNNVNYALDDDVHVIKALEKVGIKGAVVEDNFEEAFHKLFKEE